jgi:hypothetical protein
MSFGRQISRAETFTGVVILLCLLAVALGVFRQQYLFNPAVLVARTAEPKGTAPEQSIAAAWLPPELKEFGKPESFTPENLYDKIDGKAELYLAAGFVRMHCQRFALKDAADEWLEWFVYDMGTPAQAFSVFTEQRRAEARTLDVAEFAYQTQNALYFICGSNYVEAVASSAGGPLVKAMTAMARGFVAATAPGSGRLPQMELLPAQDLVPGSYTLQSADVFGFDQFKDVFTAQYKVNDAQVLAFVTSCQNADAAAALRDAYRAFLVENGGKPVAGQPGGDADKPIELMGSIEIVFSEGKYVAGVHAAPALGPAEQIAGRLHQQLAQKTK